MREPSLTKLRQAYYCQRWTAAKRGIAWKLDFVQWIALWDISGHLADRGVKKGQYVMARRGDVGPYSATNVDIILASENVSYAQANRVVKLRTRKLLSKPGTSNGAAKLTREQILEIRRIYKPRSRITGAHTLAKLVKVNPGTIINVAQHKTYKQER